MFHHLVYYLSLIYFKLFIYSYVPVIVYCCSFSCPLTQRECLVDEEDIFHKMSTIIPKVSKLTSRVIRVLGCNPGPMTLQGTNTYIIGTGNRRVLLDTGEPKIAEYTNNLKEVLKNENIKLEHIILTHRHNDHVGGVPDVLQLEHINPGCTVWKYKRTDVDEEKIKFTPLTDGQIFNTEGATLEIIHTPGHTTDHVILTLKEENAVFSGDCILGEGTTVFEDLYSYMNSLKIIQNLNPTHIYPGHGPLITEPSKAINFYIKHRTERENEILSLLNSENRLLTETDIVKVLYKDIAEHLFLAAAYTVKKHLQKLVKDGKVVKHKDGWQLISKSNL